MSTYRIFRRSSGIWFIQNRQTGKQESLRTRDKDEATRLLHARNEAVYQPSAINLQIARAYINATDPELATRRWQDVMDAILATKQGENRRRWEVAIKDRNYDLIRNIPLMETRSAVFLKVLTKGTVSTNIFLRRLHNFALSMDWLLKPVLPKPAWPKIAFRARRAITLNEHKQIIARERNPERRAFYRLCWLLGGSQTDIANLVAEDVDHSQRTVCYNRKKLQNHSSRNIKPPLVRFGSEVSTVLEELPRTGPLFPYLRTIRAGDRATEFKQRCVGLGIAGVSLHSYRYAWAERARKAGYPMRYAEEALGHNSKAVHRAYARKAEVIVPCLDEWENSMQATTVQIDFQGVSECKNQRINES